MYVHLSAASQPASCLSCLSCRQCLSLETGKIACKNGLTSYAKQKSWLREGVFDMLGLQPPGDHILLNVKRLLFPEAIVLCWVVQFIPKLNPRCAERMGWTFRVSETDVRFQ